MAEKRTVARPYARAAFSLAQEHGDLKEWSTMLETLALAAEDPQLVELVANPDREVDRVVLLLTDLCGKKMPKLGGNLLKLLGENGRLALLPEIAALYEEERAEFEKSVHAEIVSAVALSTDQQQRIKASLEKRLGKEVTISHQVDESLLGGAIIYAGDMVIDGSVTNRLEKLTNSLVR